MALSERLAYILDFNVQGAVKGLQQVGSTAEKELGKAEAKLDKLGGNLTKFGAGAVAFAGVAGVGLVKLASGAAEAEANTAALRQVVDEVSATTIEEWARGSAEAVGLASKEAIAASTGFAGLGKIIGLSGPDLANFSTELVQMAADMAAFKDVSPQQALADLQSLFAGSTEVGRKYNIFLDDATLKSAYFRETGEKVSGTLTAQQRIIATNSELYRQGADMIGQWGRESDGLAGQQAQLRANLINLGDAIGAGVLPMLTDVVGVANKAASAFGSLDPAVQKGIGRFAAFGAAGIALIGTLSLVAGQVIKMRDRFTDLDKATNTRSLNNFGKAAVGVGAALGAAAVGLAAWTFAQQQDAKQAQESIRLYGELGRVADEEIGQTFTDALMQGLLAGKSMSEQLAEFAATNIEATRRTLEHAEAVGASTEVVEALRKAIADEEAMRKQDIATIDEHGNALDTDTEAAENNARAIGGPLKKAQDDYVRGLQQKNAELRASQRELEGTNWYIRKQAEDAENASSRIDGLKESHVELRGELADRSAYLDLQDAFDNVAQAATDAYTAAAEGSEDAEQRARDFERAQIDLKQRVLDYTDAVGNIPEETTSRIVAFIDEGNLAAAEEALKNLTRQRYADVLVRLSGGTVTRDGGIDFGGAIARESGGPIPGPKGAPVPVIAHGGEHVLSADVVDAIKRGGPTRGLGTTSAAGSRGGNRIEVNIASVSSREEVEEMVRRLNTLVRIA